MAKDDASALWEDWRDSAELIRQDGFEVVLAVNAVDPDGDPLTYSFDFGDGTAPTANAGGVATHTYPDGVYTDYTITVTVTDGRDGEDQTTVEARFPEPPANQSPSFELSELVQRNGFDVVVAVSATDPDGDAVSYVFDWGDGSLPEASEGGVASHAFPDGVFAPYTVTVTADDGRGGSDQVQVAVDFPAPAENQAPSFDLAEVINRDGFDITVAVAQYQ